MSAVAGRQSAVWYNTVQTAGVERNSREDCGSWLYIKMPQPMVWYTYVHGIIYVPKISDDY
jgi:hypothetical protein